MSTGLTTPDSIKTRIKHPDKDNFAGPLAQPAGNFCRCRVSRKDPTIRDMVDPRYLENLFIDESRCALHGTVRSIRKIAASAPPPRNVSTSCGCDPMAAVVCDRALELMDDIKCAARQPVSEIGFKRLDAAKKKLGDHYREGEGDRND